jgi:hypothetical protein
MHAFECNRKTNGIVCKQFQSSCIQKEKGSKMQSITKGRCQGGRMITWFGWIGHLGQGLFMEHCSFEFWIFVGFESWWCDLGQHKEGRYGEDELLKHYWKVGGVKGIL